MTKEEAKHLCERLADEFVEAKEQKMRCHARLYLWLTKTLTEQIMFKNRPANLDALRQKIGQGEITVPTELENIMRAEAYELVSRHFDHTEGAEELYAILRRRELKGKSAKTLLEFTDLETRYKLSRMPQTFEFIGGSNLLLHYGELFF